MKIIFLIILLPIVAFSQHKGSVNQRLGDLDTVVVAGDTVKTYSGNLTTPVTEVVGKKNVDTLFLNPATFEDNVSTDSTLILKKGFKDYNTDTVIDSFKTSDNMDYLRFYLVTPNDTSRFFSVTGDSLEYWHKDMKFQAPLNLPLTTVSGNVKYFQLPHIGREFYVDFENGTNDPDSFQTSGVKDLWYASYLVNADSNGTNLIEHGQIEDSLLTAAAWTFGSNYKWSMSTSVMTGYYHPNSTKSINLTSSNAVTTKPFSITQYIPLDSGKSYTWEYLLKQTGVLALSKVSIRDSASNFTYYEDILDHTTPFDWTKFGGGLADTISTTFEIIAYREDRHLDWGEVVNHWTDAGNHTLSAEDEIFYKADWSGKVVSTGAGDSTTNYVSLATGFSELRADTTYTLTGYFFKDENSTAIGDSVTMKFGEFDTTFALTGLWKERSMVFTASAYTYANAELQIWSNKATTFYIDHFSLEYNGGDRTAEVIVQGNAIQDQGNLYLDNFIIQELVDTSLGWLVGGDAIILSGDFAEDSLNLSGKYVKGESYLPISITSKGSARILGNWAVDNGIKLDDHIYGIAVSDIYIEKCNRSALVMTSEDGGLIYGRLSRLNVDSTGRWNRTLGIASPPKVTGAYMGIDVRGQYSWISNCRITNAGNDILSIYGTHHWIRNVYGTGGYNAGNGDGFQLKASGYMTVVDNEIYSLRYLKLLAGDVIPDTLDGGVYDNKSGILINDQGGEGADYNEVSYNKIYGFSNSLAGNVRYSNIHHNYLVNPKYNILSGSIGGGTGISMIGWGCNVYDNVSIGAPIGIQLGKDLADSLNVSNNSIINFSTFGIQVKKASDTNDKIEWYNNLLYTDSIGTEIVDVHNSYVPTIWNYNLYYSPENTFDFHDSTTFAGVQNLGYEANGLNSNPLLEYGFRLKYNSPAKDAGITGLALTDYFDNKRIGLFDMGAMEIGSNNGDVQLLTIVASTDNYVVDDGGLTTFRVAGVTGEMFKVDWGDGTTSQVTLTGTEQRVLKTYANAGTYNAKIVGWGYVTKLTWRGWDAGGFNTDDLPTGLTYLYFNGLDTNITMDIDNLPSELTELFLYNLAGVGITGSIDNLPVGLTHLTISYTGENFTGGIDNLPAGLTSVNLSASSPNFTYTSPHTWGSGSDNITLQNLALDQTEIDNILCDIANSNNLAGIRSLDLADGVGNNAAPSATGEACKATLILQGWTVSTD